MHEMSAYAKVCEKAALTAGALLREKLGNVTFREKKRADLVSEADTLSQEIVFRIVKDAFPDHDFLGEESPDSSADSFRSNGDSYCWVVDPLDGTTNFVHEVPFFAVSIALVRGEEPICGVVYNPISEEFFSSQKNEGAFLNGKRIRVSEVQRASESLVAVGFPTDVQPDSPDLIAFSRAVPVAQAIRRTGSTALNLSYIAAGRFDAMWGFSTNAWDIAAGILLVREAGGIVASPDAASFSLRNPSFVAAANERLLQQWKSLLGEGK